MPVPAPDDAPPRGRWLSALADGELRGRCRAWVRRWLRVCPVLRRRYRDEQRTTEQLRDLCRQTEPSAPTDEQWRELLGRISTHVRPARARPWRAWAGAVAAAAALLALLPLTRPPAAPLADDGVELPRLVGFPVLAAHEVEVTRLNRRSTNLPTRPVEAEAPLAAAAPPTLWEPLVRSAPAE